MKESDLDDENNVGGDGDARIAGLLAFNQQRKQDSREKLVNAAVQLFSRDGYGAVTIEHITAAAGVSRITFYRHFAGKSAVALELFRRAALEGGPRLLSVARIDYHDRPALVAWLTDFFAADRDMRGILRVLSQANVEEADFSQQVQPFIVNLIASLGETIPAFALDLERPGDEVRWVKAWLLIYTIFDQSNHAATGAGIARDPAMIQALADSFLDFVSARDQQGERAG